MATWFQRLNHNENAPRLCRPPRSQSRGPDGRFSLLQRGPQYSDWLLEQLRGNNQVSVPAAARAHDVLVGALMACDFRLVRQTHDGAPPEELADHPIHRLLNYPSRVCSASELWKGYFSDYLRGNGYQFIRRDRDGLPIELVPVQCSKTVVEGNPVSRAGVAIHHYLSPVFGDSFPERETWRDRHVARASIGPIRGIPSNSSHCRRCLAMSPRLSKTTPCSSSTTPVVFPGPYPRRRLLRLIQCIRSADLIWIIRLLSRCVPNLAIRWPNGCGRIR